MKLLQKIMKRIGIAMVALMVFAMANASAVSAADNPYGPLFNYFTDAPSFKGYAIGQEKDFLRIKQGANGTTNTAEVCEGDVSMWFYVHNSQAAFNNGENYTGPGVAKDTRIRVAIPTAKSQAHVLTGYVSASNANTVSDTATITCGSEATTLEYANNVEIQTNAPEGMKINGDITSAQGATIGLNGKDGVYPGCWDHRVLVTFKVKVVKQVKPVEGDGVCKASDVTVVDKNSRKIRASVNGAVTGQGASIVGYEINWGDGSKSTKQTDEHVYAKDGEYTVTARVQVKLPDGSTKWVTSTACTKKVTFKKDVPPTVVPPVVTPPSGKLTDTGPASLAGIFAGTSALGAAAHNIVTRRRNRK